MCGGRSSRGVKRMSYNVGTFNFYNVSPAYRNFCPLRLDRLVSGRVRTSILDLVHLDLRLGQHVE